MIAPGVQWWCSARGGVWTGAWRPYPGVWLFILALGAGMALRWKGRLRPLRAAAGLLLLWAALDWPLGPLGAGYLESAHMLQFLLIVLLAPPLLLGAIPDGTATSGGRWPGEGSGDGGPSAAAGRSSALAAGSPTGASRAGRSSGRRRLVGAAAAVAVSSTLIVAGHLPPVVDALMASQLGALALDLAWLAAGLALWWPLLSPRPGGRVAAGPLRILYLYVALLPAMGIAVWLLVADWPQYRTYELAPPVHGITAVADQQMAGGLMGTAGVLILLAVAAAGFHAWGREADGIAAPERLRAGVVAE